MQPIVDRSLRTTLALVSAGVLSVSLSACDQWSASCETDNTCKIEITGNDFYKFPRPYAADDGSGKVFGKNDRIRLVRAKKGGEALIQAGGADNTCAQGSSFKVVDTTITCDVVDDDHVELTSRRA
ncbi:hypothetical protein GCM10027599_15430 [Yimella radicis]